MKHKKMESRFLGDHTFQKMGFDVFVCPAQCCRGCPELPSPVFKRDTFGKILEGHYSKDTHDVPLALSAFEEVQW